MKKVVLCFMLALSGLCFAMSTKNVGVKADGCSTVATFGIDILTHSFNSSELWIEPKVNAGCFTDNTEKCFCYGAGLELTNVYFSNGLFYGLDTGCLFSTVDDIKGFNVGLIVGVKMYNFKLSGGIEKGWYTCSDSDTRIEGSKKPVMLAINAEIIF